MPPVKHWLLDNARVLAYPSLDEGFGFPLLEAMQYRIPVVADQGIHPRSRRRAALLVDADDGVALAALAWPCPTPPARACLLAAGRPVRPSRGATRPPSSLRSTGGSPRSRRDDHGRVGGVAQPGSSAPCARGRPSSDVTVVVNTGDDTVMHGLAISPDIDTITYTLAGATDDERGWGMRDETWRAMAALQRFVAVRPVGSAAAPTWFQPRRPGPRHPLLPDGPAGRGGTLTEVTAEICAAFGVGGSTLVPMTTTWSRHGCRRSPTRPARRSASRSTSSSCTTTSRSIGALRRLGHGVVDPGRHTLTTADTIVRSRRRTRSCRSGRLGALAGVDEILWPAGRNGRPCRRSSAVPR